MGCIALHIIIIGFTKVLKCRRETFNRDFMKKHFEDLHKKIFDEDITLDRNNGFKLFYKIFLKWKFIKNYELN